MLGDIQDVKHAIARQLLGGDFLTTLAAVDAEKAVAIATPGPTQVFEGEKAQISDQGYPVVEVIGNRTIYDTASEQAKAATHEIQIVWTHVGDDELTITAQLERLVRATVDYFWPPTGSMVLMGVNAAPLTLLSEEYTALLPTRTAGQFVKGSAITLHVPTFRL